VQQLNLGLLVLRTVFGLFLSYHGYNKLRGPSGLAGTAGWFASIGMKWPLWQTRLAATTEIGAGILFAAGLLTPLAAAAMIGLMFVAYWVAHRRVGFFIFKPDQGWEYVASIGVVAWFVAAVGPGEWSLDHAFDITWSGWWGAAVAAVAGLGGGVAQLALSYRPEGAS
jgi:putative oxidoreductase